MAQTNTKKQRKPRKAETRPRDYFVERVDTPKKKDGSFDTSVKDFSYQSDSVVADVVSCLGETDEVRYIFSRNDLVDRAAVFAMKNEKEGVLDLDLFA